MLHVWCGEVVYEEALRWQRLLVDARVDDNIDDVLLTLTHDPVYTAGRHADLARTLLGTSSIRVVNIERGGDVTYHGPGQLVAYPIVKLADPFGVRAFMGALVDACVQTARSFGIDAYPDEARPGAWVGGSKLAAVGVRVDRRVTSHGLAFNVDCDLDEFSSGIVPCGLPDAGVTSLAALGVSTTVEEVRDRLAPRLADGLGRAMRNGRLDDLALLRPVSSTA